MQTVNRRPARAVVVKAVTGWWGTIRAALIGCLLGLSSLGGAVLAASPNEAPPFYANQTRVWFLNQLIPGTAMHAPMIYVNGAPIAISPEGTAFYRDFTPATYVFSIENCLPEAGTSQTVTLTPGTQVALEVLTNQNGAWDCEPSQISYLRQLSPQEVPMEFAPLSYLGPK
jgi:hypothetical protein